MKVGIFSLSSFAHNEIKIKEKVNESLHELINNLQNQLLNDEIVLANNNDYGLYDLNLIYIKTGGSESVFIKQFNEYQGPFYFIADDENNSLPASMEILTYLNNHQIKGEIIFHLMNDYQPIIDKIYSLPINKEEYVKLGVIGKPSDWLIASEIDYQKALNKWHYQLIDIDIKELIELVNNNVIIYKPNVLLPDYDQEILTDSLKIYNACKVLIAKYQLKGLTIRCFDLLNTVKTTSCLAMALLNQEGIVATCEGDLPILISMMAIKEHLNQPSFQANPAQIDEKSNSVIMAHCTIPLQMLSSYTFTSHFESGIGIAIKGELPLKEITIFRLSNDLTNYYVTTGYIKANLNRPNLCRTQILINQQEPVNYYLTKPLGNHHLIILGNYQEKIITMMK